MHTAANDSTTHVIVDAVEDRSDTSPEVRAAARQLREDAEARGKPRMLIEPPPDEDTSGEQEAIPRRTHASVGQPDEPAPELDRPPPRRRRLNLDRRQVLGFGILAVAVIVAAGYLIGVVGVHVSITDGHPLECGFGEKSLHIEKHFVVFGAELVRLDREIRCTSGAR